MIKEVNEQTEKTKGINTEVKAQSSQMTSITTEVVDNIDQTIKFLNETDAKLIRLKSLFGAMIAKKDQSLGTFENIAAVIEELTSKVQELDSAATVQREEVSNICDNIELIDKEIGNLTSMMQTVA